MNNIWSASIIAFIDNIHRSKGGTEKAVYHLEVALGTASFFDWFTLLFTIHFSLAALFFDRGRFDDAHGHIEHAKSHAANGHDTYLLAHAMWLRAEFWHRQHRFEEARSKAFYAVDAFKKLGAADGSSVRSTVALERAGGLIALREWDDDGELLETVPLVV